MDRRNPVEVNVYRSSLPRDGVQVAGTCDPDQGLPTPPGIWILGQMQEGSHKLVTKFVLGEGQIVVMNIPLFQEVLDSSPPISQEHCCISCWTGQPAVVDLTYLVQVKCMPNEFICFKKELVCDVSASSKCKMAKCLSFLFFKECKKTGCWPKCDFPNNPQKNRRWQNPSSQQIIQLFHPVKKKTMHAPGAVSGCSSALFLLRSDWRTNLT